MDSAVRRLLTRAYTRPLTLAYRRAKVLEAIRALAIAADDWPIDRRGLGELGEALALLDYVQRQLHD